ncbi:MAG: hypothetical protein ACJAU6_003058 [Alphaproteobacteria bacterium]|jgi:hypothetical protein
MRMVGLLNDTPSAGAGVADQPPTQFDVMTHPPYLSNLAAVFAVLSRFMRRTATCLTSGPIRESRRGQSVQLVLSEDKRTRLKTLPTCI